jgi:hypothetical protein
MLTTNNRLMIELVSLLGDDRPRLAGEDSTELSRPTAMPAIVTIREIDPIGQAGRPT